MRLFNWYSRLKRVGRGGGENFYKYFDGGNAIEID